MREKINRVRGAQTSVGNRRIHRYMLGYVGVAVPMKVSGATLVQKTNDGERNADGCDAHSERLVGRRPRESRRIPAQDAHLSLSGHHPTSQVGRDRKKPKRYAGKQTMQRGNGQETT
jgi:hypothetical protein